MKLMIGDPVQVLDSGLERLSIQIGYSVELQRAIENHCRGREVDESSGNCPHHARMLNEQLKKQKRLCDAIEGIQDWSGTEVGDALDDLMGYSDAVKE